MTKLSPIIESPSQELSSEPAPSSQKLSTLNKSTKKKIPLIKPQNIYHTIKSEIDIQEDKEKQKEKFLLYLEKNKVPIGYADSRPAKLHRNNRFIEFCKEHDVNPSDIDPEYNDWESVLKDINLNYKEILDKLFDAQYIGGRKQKNKRKRTVKRKGGKRKGGKRKSKSKRKRKSKRKNKFGGSKGG